jgi:hypothetical protein
MKRTHFGTASAMKTYTLTNADGKRYESTTQGTLGGHKRNKGYGRQRIIGRHYFPPN